MTDNLKVVDIPAPGTHPRILSVKDWTGKYKVKNVVRLNDTAHAKKAGAWARWYQVKYKKANYTIWSNLTSFNSTYCSQLVWQSYKYGAKWDLTQRFFYRSGSWIPTSAYMKIAPYEYLTSIFRYPNTVY